MAHYWAPDSPVAANGDNTARGRRLRLAGVQAANNGAHSSLVGRRQRSVLVRFNPKVVDHPVPDPFRRSPAGVELTGMKSRSSTYRCVAVVCTTIKLIIIIDFVFVIPLQAP